MENEPQGNAAVLRDLCSELLRRHVTEFCVAAGARNAPLIKVILEMGLDFKVWHFLDERSAAFFALGRTAVTGKKAAVVTTSGTAAGELLPAMMEAYYRGLPLVAITADRPVKFRRSGAPQSVEQDGIFGRYAAVRWEGKYLEEQRLHDLHMGEVTACTMHFNVFLEEEAVDYEFVPLGEDSPDYKSVWDAREKRKYETWKEAYESRTFWKKEGKLAVLVAGIPSESPVWEFLLYLGAPIVAEATANLPSNEALRALLVQGGEKALKALNPHRVLRVGDVPSWRWWRDLEEREYVHVLSVGNGFRGLARTTNVELMPIAWLMHWPGVKGVLRADMLDSQQPAVLKDRGASIASHLDELLQKFPHAEPAWVRQLSRVIPAGATVFLGNSLPIREWNLAAAPAKRGTRFFANRGANGIDGLISSGLGVGAEADNAWIIVGDLSALYDMNAPWILPQLKNKRWRIVVINNGGGKIFSRVAWLRGLPEAVQEMVENRHTLHFEHWAKQWNLEYRRFENAADLRDDDAACAMWEIIPDAEQTEAFWAAWK
jgi:2-succinyl-5-enolpyruvyl-6-hydroxy-3-cyclohexene-1-carboxylate synthase